MNEKQRKEVTDLYGSNDPTSAYMIDSGTRFSNTEKKDLENSLVDDLDDSQSCLNLKQKDLMSQ